jgi:uncharacterized membrane protein YdjX (TVP38/TMEM64 family)
MSLIPWMASPARRVAVFLLAVLGAASLYFLHPEWFLHERLVAMGRNMPAGWLLAAFLVLPALGFPISIPLLIAGMRFGFVWGMAWSAVAVAFHHVLIYWMAHGWMRPRIVKWLEDSPYQIPEIDRRHQVGWTVFFAAAHGPPYALKLYLLALTDMPFRIYAGVGAPVYILFCALPVGIGSSVWNVDPLWAYVVLGAAALALWLFCKVRRRFAKGRRSKVD